MLLLDLIRERKSIGASHHRLSHWLQFGYKYSVCRVCAMLKLLLCRAYRSLNQVLARGRSQRLSLYVLEDLLSTHQILILSVSLLYQLWLNIAIRLLKEVHSCQLKIVVPRGSNCKPNILLLQGLSLVSDKHLTLWLWVVSLVWLVRVQSRGAHSQVLSGTFFAEN